MPGCFAFRDYRKYIIIVRRHFHADDGRPPAPPPEVRVCEGIVRTPIRPGHRILLSQELHPRGGGDDAIVLLVQSMSESNSEARREGGRGECRAATNIGY